MRAAKVLRPDAKGRITLGKLAQGISGFYVRVDKHHQIVLEPYVEIPAREKWLFDNPAALKRVKQGLVDSAAGRLRNRGRFAQYANTSDD